MHSLLEKYLSEVAAQLKVMPAVRRASEINELRAHLQEATETYQASGQGEEEALQAALRQFGPSHQVGRELKQTWLSRLRHTSWQILGTTAAAFTFSVAQPILLFGIFNFDGWLHRVCTAQQVELIHALQPSVMASVAGLLAGTILPRRAIPAAAVSWTAILLLDEHLSFVQSSAPRPLTVALPLLAAIAAAYWSARLGQHWGQLLRHKSRRSETE